MYNLIEVMRLPVLTRPAHVSILCNDPPLPGGNVGERGARAMAEGLTLPCTPQDAARFAAQRDWLRGSYLQRWGQDGPIAGAQRTEAKVAKPVTCDSDATMRTLRAMYPDASDRELQTAMSAAMFAAGVPAAGATDVQAGALGGERVEFRGADGGIRFRAGRAEVAAGSRIFTGTAYSGGIITDHPMYERVAFNLDSTRLALPAPLLYKHQEPIGIVERAELAGNIRISGKVFADKSPDAKKVADFSDAGMVWQLSVGIWPGRIEEVKAGAKVKLNGKTFDGPLTVFHDSRVREVSFVALGADGATSARVE